MIVLKTLNEVNGTVIVDSVCIVIDSIIPIEIYLPYCSLRARRIQNTQRSSIRV